MGVATLELDLVVSKDQQLVVSHDPFFSPYFCLDSIGQTIPEDSIINIYQLTYEEIARCDCGSIGNPKFPEQEKIKIGKPLLSEVIEKVEEYIEVNKVKPVRYNIELKTTKATDSVFHPTPAQFSELVFALIEEYDITDRVTIQSFDFRTLQYFNEWHIDVELALLIENDLGWEINVDSLGFNPEIYSSDYPLLSQEIVADLQSNSMKVIPWTVNKEEDISRLLSWGVDGIISDYPNRVLEVIE